MFPQPLALHRFECNGRKLVYDINTCFFFEAEDLTWEVLARASQANDDEIVASLSDRFERPRIAFTMDLISQLIAQGVLTRQDQVVSAPIKNYAPRFLFMSISHDCNLRCRYCYAESGTYYRGESGLMTTEVARQTVEFLYRNGARDTSNYVIRYFGGEPMMNWPIIQETIEWSKKMAAEYGIPTVHEILTNGTLFTPERLRYCIDHDVHLVISVDGPRDVHDAMRCFKEGMGSYETIMARLGPALASHQILAAARPTLRSDNADFVRVVQHLFDLGFAYISPEPLWRTPEGTYGWSEEEVPLLKEQMTRLAYWYLDKLRHGELRYGPLRPFGYVMVSAATGALAVEDTYCGAGKQMLSVDYKGDIYPCFRFFSVPEFKMGNVTQDGVDASIKEQFVKTRYSFVPECQNCWAHSLCGGAGCPAEGFFVNGAVDRPHHPFCEVYRLEYELTMMIYCTLRQENARLLRLFSRGHGYKVDGRYNTSAGSGPDKLTIASRGLRL